MLGPPVHPTGPRARAEGTYWRAREGPALTAACVQVYEVVRPLVSLLHLNCSGLQNFEALMALTNLAGISERLR